MRRKDVCDANQEPESPAMPLFAETDFSQVLLGALSTGSVIATALIGWKSNRDKLEFDAGRRDDAAKITALQTETAELKADHAACAGRTAAIEADLKACKDQHAAADVDRAELRGQLTAVKDLLGKQDAARLAG